MSTQRDQVIEMQERGGPLLPEEQQDCDPDFTDEGQNPHAPAQGNPYAFTAPERFSERSECADSLLSASVSTSAIQDEAHALVLCLGAVGRDLEQASGQAVPASIRLRVQFACRRLSDIKRLIDSAHSDLAAQLPSARRG